MAASDVCAELGDLTSPLGAFARRWSPNLRTDLCPEAGGAPQEDVMFNPFDEEAPLLRAWLRYRGLPRGLLDSLGQPELGKLAVDDMLQRFNVPAFKRFFDFVPAETSQQFLINWLSWYGIGPPSSVEQRSWLELKTKQLIKLHRLEEPRETKPAFEALAAARQQQAATTHLLRCASLYLSLHPEQQEAAAPSGPTTPVAPTLRDTQLLNTRRLLAYFLGAAAVAAPLVVRATRKRAQGDDVTTNTSTLLDRTQRNLQGLVRKKGPMIGALLAAGYAAPKVARALNVKNEGFVTAVSQSFVKDMFLMAVSGGKVLPPNVIGSMLKATRLGKGLGTTALGEFVLPALFAALQE